MLRAWSSRQVGSQESLQTAKAGVSAWAVLPEFAVELAQGDEEVERIRRAVPHSIVAMPTRSSAGTIQWFRNRLFPNTYL